MEKRNKMSPAITLFYKEPVRKIERELKMKNIKVDFAMRYGNPSIKK